MTEEVELKECQLCHQTLPKDQFYKRKDRDGEHNWTMSYCGPCDSKKAAVSRSKKPEYYKNYYKNKSNIYYNENKDKYKIYHKRAYYKKLSPEKQIIYLEKLQEKYPDMVDKICEK